MDKIKKFPDIYKLSRAAADYFVNLSRAATQRGDRFSVALSGGSTPESLYALLATEAYASRVDWPMVHLFWGDERCVPPDHIDSNYRMAQHAFIKSVPIPVENVHRIPAERPPEEAARLYERELRQFFGGMEWPRFDLILLGIGDDGHTASLFPHSPALQVTDQWVAENYIEKLDVWRVTLTAPAINAAANIAFMAIGEKKAGRIYEVTQGSYQPDSLPAQLIQPTNGKLVWLVDEAAGSLV
ncbi:MAG: 6-phosphogluconolactonase [Anaerolineae bacterium]|nr:6-phosphogluconolactonase [Anaerolineae bacterium]